MRTVWLPFHVSCGWSYRHGTVATSGGPFTATGVVLEAINPSASWTVSVTA